MCRSGVSGFAVLVQLRVELCRQRDINLKLEDDILEVIAESKFSDNIAEMDHILGVGPTQEIKREDMVKKVDLLTIPFQKLTVVFWNGSSSGSSTRPRFIVDMTEGMLLMSPNYCLLTWEAAQLMIDFNNTNAEYSEVVIS